MYSRFNDIEALRQAVMADKQPSGMGAVSLDRYPIRFVLFDTFADSLEFVEWLQADCGALVQSVAKWIAPDYPDLMITQCELAECIANYIKANGSADCVIAPFSELARFYDNEEKKAFDALIKTIKGIEATPEAVESHQRVYIPIVGLEGKMETFVEDSQINIWRMTSGHSSINYRLIVTPETDYGVKGCEANYTIVNNIREWLNLWHDTKLTSKPEIICKSKAIYANARYAQPDNAFSYEVCDNAYDFLVNGLHLSLGGIEAQNNDEDNWERLAADIDISNGFSFKGYIQRHFEVNEIEDYKDFIRLWLRCPAKFDRWLLARYFVNKEKGNGYLCNIINSIGNYGTNELIERIATTLSYDDNDIAIRRYCLQKAAENHVALSESAENELGRKLIALPEKMGYAAALKYFTPLSRKEKNIAIVWMGAGHITADDIKPFFHDLSIYMKEGTGVELNVPKWVNGYFIEYKKAKVSNQYTTEIKQMIETLNASEAKFNEWYNDFSTTYTQLQNRGDIEVYYWIDGMGVDWIPLVKQIVEEKKEQQIFLNEIMIARAKLPTKTETNRLDLQRLQPEKPLEKCGDLDAFAHQQGNICPFSICDEIALVRKSIEDILNKYIGKKIAIVSDHGLTYMSQLAAGKNMAGVDSDHHGRVAICHNDGKTTDCCYIRLDDGKTLCALKHDSLCGKVPNGQGAHGGCTPEEVLVPVFVISSSPAATNWEARLLMNEISGTEPRVHFEIKNISTSDIPYAEYDGRKYKLHHLKGDEYVTEDIALNNDCSQIIVCVGAVMRPFEIVVKTGVEEDDLFTF